MSMKFLILNTDYPEFLRWLHARHPGLEKALRGADASEEPGYLVGFYFKFCNRCNYEQHVSALKTKKL
jgi:hypothetical protein